MQGKKAQVKEKETDSTLQRKEMGKGIFSYKGDKNDNSNINIYRERDRDR